MAKDLLGKSRRSLAFLSQFIEVAKEKELEQFCSCMTKYFLVVYLTNLAYKPESKVGCFETKYENALFLYILHP